MSQVRFNNTGAPIRLERDAVLNPPEFESPEDVDFNVVSVLHGKLEGVYNDLPERLKTISEFDLCAEADPGPTEYKLRQNFFNAVKVARAKGTKIRVTSIYEEVVSKPTFFMWYVTNQAKMAFIMRPVVLHEQYYAAIFHEGLRKLFKYVRNHDLDPKTIATFARIVEKAGDRVIGPVAQRIQMHQRQEITHSSGDAREVTPNDPAELEAKIREMQAKLSQTKPIEITSSNDDIEI